MGVATCALTVGEDCADITISEGTKRCAFIADMGVYTVGTIGLINAASQHNAKQMHGQSAPHHGEVPKNDHESRYATIVRN